MCYFDLHRLFTRESIDELTFYVYSQDLDVIKPSWYPTMIDRRIEGPDGDRVYVVTLGLLRGLAFLGTQSNNSAIPSIAESDSRTEGDDGRVAAKSAPPLGVESPDKNNITCEEAETEAGEQDFDNITCTYTLD